jgi:hypothetical protein
MPFHEFLEPDEIRLSLSIQSLPHLLDAFLFLAGFILLPYAFTLVEDTLPPIHLFLNEFLVLVSQSFLFLLKDLKGCGLAVCLKLEGLHDLGVEPLLVADLEVSCRLCA